MRILYIDIDSLRPDHLGCYGYHRPTSPTIDALAADGVRFTNCYVSDGPCLPSRTALWSGRTGYRTGVVNHGGSAAQPFGDGSQRGFRDTFSTSSWTAVLRDAGYQTVAISSFAQRHSAWHWYAGFRSVVDPGLIGLEIAPQVTSLALEWISTHGRADDWFLHVNYWDPHTPYRTPVEYGEPFADDPIPAWLTEEVRERCWAGYGPQSAREPHGFQPSTDRRWPRVPREIDSMRSVKAWIDGYDTGIRYMDDHLGQILNALADCGVLDETVIIVGADHGECLGELNVWGDHHTADDITARVPLVVRWPGMPSSVDSGLHYQFDWAATLLDMLGLAVPPNWDGRSFAAALRDGKSTGRPDLILSHGAWSCGRSVRWDHYICLRIYHDGYADLKPVMLFDLCSDPHEQTDLAAERPDLVGIAMGRLATWQHEMMLASPTNVDPLMTVLREGGPWQVRGHLGLYLDRLRHTGRTCAARFLESEHAAEISLPGL